MCGCLSADAVTTDRDTVPGSGLDIVLCEVCNTPSLVCAAPGVMLPHATGRTTRNVLMDRRPVVSLKTPRGLCPRSMT